MYFPKLRGPKNALKKISKNFGFREPFERQHVRGIKHCRNLKHTTFTIFIDHCEGNSVGKKSPILIMRSVNNVCQNIACQ